MLCKAMRFTLAIICVVTLSTTHTIHCQTPSNTTFEHCIVMTLADFWFAPYKFLSSAPAYIYMHNPHVAVCKARYTMGDNDVTYRHGIDGQGKSWTTDLVSKSLVLGISWAVST
ncbi:hypothetical protein HD806DRAFT_224622 [Xylariaceae sp. AK1471]|nr:hypothetical protein HD806DRAFT_224622 [Xylariaceae sp. AK1471]